MITIGVDAHKSLHVALAINEAGRTLEHWRGPNSPQGWQDLQQWATALGTPRRWGIEGASNYGRGLAQALVEAGETVYEINPRWTAQTRRSARTPGKTDRLDAQAVASLVLRDHASLPQVQLEDATSLLDLLVKERETVLAEATRLRNQLHFLLLQVDPQYRDTVPALTTPEGLEAVEQYSTSSAKLMDTQRVAAVHRLAQRLRLAHTQAAELRQEIETRTQEAGFSPLTELKGVGLLTAGAIAGILGPGKRFQREAQVAAYAGAAPLETSSAGKVRHRLNRGGNRRLNAILYRIAFTQAGCLPAAKTYLADRKAEGKTTKEAFRTLKRYLVRAIWKLWLKCLAPLTPPALAAAA